MGLGLSSWIPSFIQRPTGRPFAATCRAAAVSYGGCVLPLEEPGWQRRTCSSPMGSSYNQLIYNAKNEGISEVARP